MTPLHSLPMLKRCGYMPEPAENIRKGSGIIRNRQTGGNQSTSSFLNQPPSPCRRINPSGKRQCKLENQFTTQHRN
jgi:hypothetical protein